MKKIISICSLFLLTACAQPSPDVGLVLYDMVDPYIEVFADQLEEELSEYDYLVYNSENSQTLQNDQLQELLDKDVRLMIVNPVDRLSTFTLIRRLREENIPVIFFNREPLRKDLQEYTDAYYVGAKPEQSGYIQADMIAELFGEADNLTDYDKNGDGVIQTIMFKGQQGHQDAEIRSRSVIDKLEDEGYEVELLQTIIADWNREQAYTEMKQVIQDEIPYELIISNNDAMAVGAIDAIKELSVFEDDNEDGLIDQTDESWIPIVGVDGIQMALDEIENGYLYGTVVNDSESMARAIGELAQYLLGEIEKEDMSFEFEDRYYIWIDYTIYTKDIEE
jgi:methyl-galactoside transport system substrate-binding protein